MRRSDPFAGAAFVGAVAIAAVAAIFVLNVLREHAEPQPAAAPSASPPASASATGRTSGSPATSPSAAGVRPDAKHGILTRGTGDGILRAESDPKALRTFPQRYAAATTRDGLRVAYIRTTETGQQLLVFDTARPTSEKTLVDLSGSGEVATDLVWASDQPTEVLFAVFKREAGAPESAISYAALRTVDAGTSKVTEIARTTNRLALKPIIWRGASSTAVAIETVADGMAASYILVRGGTLTRSPFETQVVASSVRADGDGQRILQIGGGPSPRGVKWWAFDRFDQKSELKADPNFDISIALWRPGTDEIVVYASPMTKGAPGAAPRLEAWNVGGARRTIAEGAGPLGLMRVDGTAVVTTAWTLVDLATGATSPIPEADRDQQPYLAVLF